MVYIYDILLNFNKNLIEYFDWEDSDSIKYIKKVALFKVNSFFIRDIFYKDVILSDEFISIVPKYEMDGIKDTGSICLFSDGFITIGVFIKDKRIVSFSRLLLDEEREALDICSGMDELSIKYDILNDRDVSFDFLTKNERNMRDKLICEIDNLYDNKCCDELFYLFYEYSGKESSNINYVYNFLKTSLSNFDDKHKMLFDILLLSNASLNEK